MTHAGDVHSDTLHSILGLVSLLQDLTSFLGTTQEWDVRDDSTTAALIKCREGLTLLRPDHPLLPGALFIIARVLISRFKALDHTADIDDAITYLDESLTIPPSWKDGSIRDEEQIITIIAGSLSLLGDALVLRFKHSNGFEDVDAAIENYRVALMLSSPDDRQSYLEELVKILRLRFQEHGRKEDIDEAIRWYREAVSLSQTEPDEGDTHESQAQYLNGLGDLLALRYRNFSQIADLEEANESYETAIALLPDISERRPHYLRDLALSLYRTFKAKGQIEDLNGAIDRVREAIECLSNGNLPLDEDDTHEYLAQHSKRLGYFLALRHKKFGLIADLEEAAESYRTALTFLPHNSGGRSEYLRDLAVCLFDTFEAKGQIEDLNGAIDHLREAITCQLGGNVPPDDDEAYGYLAKNLDQLGDLLVLRYRKIRQFIDLEEATNSYGKALVSLPDNSQSRPLYLRDLAVSLRETFEAKGRVEDLNGAIDCAREAIACLPGRNIPPDEDETYRSLRLLGSLLAKRFQWAREMSDLDEAIQCQYSAMEVDPTKRYSALDSLSTYLHFRYDVTGDRSDVERALDFSREALDLCPVEDSSVRFQIKSHMADYLDTQFVWSKRAEDSKEALNIRRELVALSEGTADYPQHVGSLVHSLDSQYYRDPGQLNSLDEGMKQLREVLRTVGHSPDHTDLLHQLGVSSYNRYQRSDAPEDLEEAITCFREVLALTPRGHIQYADYLSNLATSLQCRYKLFWRTEDLDGAIKAIREAVAISSLRQLDDLEEAITVFREAVSLSSPDSWGTLRNLAVCIDLRYGRLRQPDDAEEAIALLRKSLTLIPSGHPAKLRSLGALATVALSRCEFSGRIEDQYDALEVCRENVAAYDGVPSDSLHCMAIRYLAQAYWIKGDHEEAFTQFEEAVNLCCATGTPVMCFKFAMEWALKARTAGHSSSLRGHMKALELLDRCLTSTPTIDLQHQFLTENNSFLATHAASCAIEKSDLEIAVQALEQGRALLWSRMRDYRHSIEALHEVNPSLADDFKRVCQQLEHLTVSSDANLLGISPIFISSTPHAAVGLDFDVKMTNNRELSEHYERIISEIRQLDGFSSFLQATPFPTLQTAASEGPVILINVDEHRSDGMILRATEPPLLVRLPGNLSSTVNKLSTQLVVADRMNRDGDRYGVDRRSVRFDVKHILQVLWKEVCQPIALALQKMGHTNGSRVWWCPSGRLAALPLHASGIYNDKGVLIEGFPDLYVSSYTPTLSSLIASRETAVKDRSGPRLLAVGQSNSLPKVEEEFCKLKNLFSDDVLKIRDGEGAKADAVLDDLQDHPWAHFACHGMLDANSPFKSGFILHKKNLSLRDIMQAKLPNAELAFLAACHSAASESTSKTPDEVLTLAAAMQFCGFRSIVGTLWTMSDSDGPVLAEKFYKHMLRNGLDDADVRDSAEAVHFATKSMREAGVPLHRWTTFVHVGI
ncbi:hypothetical protein EW026_g4624 [Hermanssonia centrifuga]|uniref:CHAT domain-containing protein n=1 Tax=Hermanssonia centrifuga TaxID=98765 RepID=A0A4S4KHA3_9APHY|nr:hypothetical protein EW026_g4624 [Hermanssonia centrifuga]